DFIAVHEVRKAESRHDDSVRAELLNEAAQRLVETSNHGRHGDDRRYADDDTEHRQARAHLVRAHGLEGHDDDFTQKPEPDVGYSHSRRNASMGSRRAARIAG